MSEILTTLRQLWLPGVNLDELWANHRGNAVRARRWQTVFHTEDPSDALYLLLDGELRAFVSDSETGGTSLLLRGPALFGDRDLLLRTTARETYEFVTAGRMLVWSGEQFLCEWRANVELRAGISLDLAARYACCVGISEWTAQPLEQRLARLLTAIQRTASDASSTEQLAYFSRLLGVAEKSVQRALTHLRKPVAPVSPRRLPSEISLTTSQLPTTRPPLFHQLAQAHFG